jgi:hypothetical protein
MMVSSLTHQLTRLAFDAGQPYESFRTRYETAVPTLDPQRLAAFAGRHAPWQEVVADVGVSAKHGFFLYWRSDLTPLMSRAGDTWPCTDYPMANHTIAERSCRQDPSVMLYAPLRTVIYVDADNRTSFAVDQPGTVFSSFGQPAIAQVGAELDQKLASLLKAVGIPARRALLRSA